jgi:DNA-binding MarR family transcriptional regulator
MVERAIRPSGEPVIGLLLFMVYGRLARSMSGRGPFAIIKPGSIGIPALLKAHPGLSQTELADLLGVQRMTAGMQVQQCIRAGLVRRIRSGTDRRKYRLYITRKGQAYLGRVARLIPLHEQYLFGALKVTERNALHRALRKLVDTSES